MPRFVILEHDHPSLHWDLMLEDGPALRTWRLFQPPEVGCGVRAEASFDHRLLYLDYEGPISGGRGTVRRWDQGVFSWAASDGTTLEIVLRGRRIEAVARYAEGRWIFSTE